MPTEPTVEPIRVWSFYQAPKEWQELSEHGGDEDWLAHVPAGNPKYEWLPWAETGSPFGCCDVSEHPLPDGSLVLIGAHS